MIETRLNEVLKKISYPDELRSVMEYALFPSGKLFRPRLVEALRKDLKQPFDKDFLHLACAIELHHAYTLVHDDLPSMDNDSFRRGKPSTHAQFGEWKAILAGDALLVASFQELVELPSSLLKLFTWATGARGLISGQFEDLKAQGNLSAKDVIRVHELKTGRLIQVATLGSYLLSKQVSSSGIVDFFRLGRNIGLCFQLLDDLTEIKEENLSSHELEINPFVSNFEASFQELNRSKIKIDQMTKKYELSHFKDFIDQYFKKNKKMLLTMLSQDKISKLKLHPQCLTDLEKWTSNL